MKTFYQKLSDSTKKNNSLLCVGLDSDYTKLPSRFHKVKHPQFAFNKFIIDRTHDLVSAYKPNSAFYEARGASGIEELKMTMDYLHKRYPHILTILDAKRADIGNTNNGYVSFIFDFLGVDAVTLQPYLGREAIQPFLERVDKGSIILCRTSNPGAGEFQDLSVGKRPLYQEIAYQVAAKWNTKRNCGLVVGATYPEELKIVRRIAKNIPLLIPGIGAQGGDLAQSVKFGVDEYGAGIMVNAARSVIFAQEPREEAQQLRDSMNTYRKGGT